VSDLSQKAYGIGATGPFDDAGVLANGARSGDFLTCAEASAYLWAKFRLKRSERRLAQLRLVGTGPGYHRAGNAVRYRRDALDSWALAVLGGPMTSTAAEAVRRQVA
jgi:hypothetical protein